MRIHTSLPIAFLSIGILAGCGDQEIMAPETAALEAPSAASFQQQRVAQTTFGNLIAALNNINAQIIALNNIDIQNVDVRVVDIDTLNLNVQQVRILNNILNNNDIDIDILRNALQNFLNNNDIDVNVDIGQVVAIDVLSGDFIIFTQ